MTYDRTCIFAARCHPIVTHSCDNHRIELQEKNIMNMPTCSAIDTSYNPFINRETSVLAFNRRVLSMASNERFPLLERLRYLCISSSNLDEFFEIRYASLLELAKDPDARTKPDGMRPLDAIALVNETAHKLVNDQYDALQNTVLPALENAGIRFLRRDRWTNAITEWVADYFDNELQPLLTPLGLDPSHPFPRLLNKSLNFIVPMEGRDAFGRLGELAVVQVPRALPRIIQLPENITGSAHDFIFLSSAIHANVQKLFPGMMVKGCYQFRVTRNSNLFVDEEEVDDLLTALQGELSSRKYGNAVRLEVADNCPDSVADYLLQRFRLPTNALFKVNGPVNLHRLSAIPDMVSNRPDLVFTPYTPSIPSIFEDAGSLECKTCSIFDTLKAQDILLHHPFQSFAPVVNFIRQAASDDQVLAIRMTLYRTGTNSAIVEALEQAAKRGKEVTAVIELRARFDEDNNIQQATRLQEAGAHVVYGVVGYKTHAKMISVLRKETDGLRYYTHLGTGNYHAGTARVYTDFGLMTSAADIGRDVNRIFQQLTSFANATDLEVLWQAPHSLHRNIKAAIAQETTNALASKPARIVAKMNGLQQRDVIEALYTASQAGVQIDLIVRGLCSLRPGVAGLSENIRVRSILGRFLEHHRVFYFQNNDQPTIWLASADWMSRNLLSRVETCFPIRDPELAKRVFEEGLNIYLKDTNSWQLCSNGDYIQHQNEETTPFNAQQTLIEKYQK
jgi:polyphosphate kinase